MEELIKEALNGDQKAYIKLFQLIGNDLLGLAMIKLKNREDAEDVIQNTMIKTFRKLHKLKDHSKFESWVKKILVNECKDFYRKTKIQNSTFAKIISGNDYLEYEFPMEKIEEDIDFQEFLKNFDEKDKIILVLHFAQHNSASEIAEVLKMNVNTVKSRITRMKKKIEKLEEGRSVYE